MRYVRFHRRDFLRAAAGTAAAGCGASRLYAGGASEAHRRAVDEGARLPKPTPAQLTWQECEIGVIYHFDLPIAAGQFAPNNMVRQKLDPNLYQPVKLDTDQWLAGAVAAGAGYAVFTATHFNGFMQWQSDLYPYGLKQTRWRDGKGDVVADFVASCRKVGIRPGIYLSCHRNVYWELWGHYVDWGKGRDTEAQRRYNRVAEQMTEELCSRYGPLVELWYDAGVKTPQEGGPDVLPIVEKHQPNIVFYSSRRRSDHRWIGNEKGFAGDPCWATMPGSPSEVSHNAEPWQKRLLNGDPNGSAWSPGMVDVPLRGANRIHNWFWHPDQDQAAEPAEKLVQMYYESVGRNANFIVGEVIAPQGLVPESDLRRLEEFGREIRRRLARPIAETNGVGAEIVLKLPQPRRIDHVVLMEDIAHGERIREYTVEGLTPDATWKKLASAESVGHKRIHRMEPVEVAAVRLRVARSTATPMLRQVAVFTADPPHGPS